MTRKVKGYIPGLKDSSFEEREQHTAAAFSDHQQAIEGELQLPTAGGPGNVVGSVRFVTFREADRDEAVPHGLGYAPTVVIPGLTSEATNLYAGSKAHDAQNVYIRCDTANVTVSLLIW